jgi:hypothetical protein
MGHLVLPFVRMDNDVALAWFKRSFRSNITQMAVEATAYEKQKDRLAAVSLGRLTTTPIVPTIY